MPMPDDLPIDYEPQDDVVVYIEYLKLRLKQTTGETNITMCRDNVRDILYHLIHQS